MASQLRAIMAGLTLALALGVAAPARAATATMSAVTAPEGYTRIEFFFDDAPEAQARLANGVLVVTFSEPVDLKQELGRGLGALIGAIRRDPDGTAIRMALNGAVRIVATPAGERFFVDLLPTSWNALPPPLPKDVIEQLSRDSREARALKAEEARLRAAPKATLTVEGATHPTFRRLIFKLGGQAPVDYRRSGPTAVVSIDAPYAFDLAAARARLPMEFAGLATERTSKGLRVIVPAAGGGAIRGFREDDDFILDIDRDDRAAEDAAAARGQDDHAEAPPVQRRAPAPHAPEAATPASVKTPERPGPAPVVAQTPVAAAGHAAPDSLPAAKAAASAHPAEKRSSTPTPSAATPSPPPPAEPIGPSPAASSGAAAETARAPSILKVGQSLRLVFPFSRQTPAAIFARGKTLWAVFDHTEPLALDQFVAGSAGAITAVEPFAVERGQAVRIRLAEPRLVSASVESQNWVVSIGEDVMARSGSVEFIRATDKNGRPSVQAELPGLGVVRSLVDPEIGDRISVVTLAAPARGLPVARQFVEFAALPSAQGLALSVPSDDVSVVMSIERVSIERPGGLTMSPMAASAAVDTVETGKVVLGAADWAAENAGPFSKREAELMRGAALSSLEDRPDARLALAKFYQARGRAADSAAVLGALVEDAGLADRDPGVAILRAATSVELGRPAAALAILSATNLRMTPEAALWRAAAEEAMGRLDQARAALKDGTPAISQLPPELRARFKALGIRLAIEAGDIGQAEALYQDIEILPATEGVGAREILRARIEEALGNTEKAALAFATVARRGEPAAAAEAELRSVSLGLKAKTLTSPDAIGRLERLTTGWRGDRIEADALARLIDLYSADGRWRDAFSTLRTAVEAYPDAEDTRALQDRMQARFAELFLGDALDKMPKLDALALFYDFKELMPGGRRGDELVRRLADKLVEVDLLDQAAELLTYQVENRLTGAARAQVASRAALVELMNGKPARAIEMLRKTRQADLPAALVKTRTRLEARALAETGRIDLALEMAEGLDAPEARRARADILWSARRWPEAGEALEAALGSVWRGSAPLDGAQRSEVMRAAIASALAGDGLAVDRIRQKYAAKMADSPEASGFEIVTAPIEARGDAFREIARSVASTASFRTFLDEYRRGAAQAVDGQAAADGQTPPKA